MTSMIILLLADWLVYNTFKPASGLQSMVTKQEVSLVSNLSGNIDQHAGPLYLYNLHIMHSLRLGTVLYHHRVLTEYCGKAFSMFSTDL